MALNFDPLNPFSAEEKAAMVERVKDLELLIRGYDKAARAGADVSEARERAKQNLELARRMVNVYVTGT